MANVGNRPQSICKSTVLWPKLRSVLWCIVRPALDTTDKDVVVVRSRRRVLILTVWHPAGFGRDPTNNNKFRRHLGGFVNVTLPSTVQEEISCIMLECHVPVPSLSLHLLPSLSYLGTILSVYTRSMLSRVDVAAID